MWNAHHKFKLLIVYLFMCFTLTACPPISPEEIKDLLPIITKIERLGFEFRAFGSPIAYEVNWCGGTAEYGKDVGQVGSVDISSKLGSVATCLWAAKTVRSALIVSPLNLPKT